MATLEQVEKLKERAAVSYDEAKAALNACSDDLLDALIYLEKQGKVNAPAGGGFYSSGAAQQKKDYHHCESADQPGESPRQLLRRLGRWLRSLLHKGNTNLFQVWKDGKTMITVPVTVLVLLLLFCFWFVVPLLIVGLFFDCRYRFVGADVDKIDVNKVMDSAADMAENLKRDITNNDEI